MRRRLGQYFRPAPSSDDDRLHQVYSPWVAIASLHRTLTCYSLPISRRTSVRFLVRRAKARFLSGCEYRPATVAPAGSNRTSRRGNEAAAASGVEPTDRDLATMQD